MTLIEKKIGSDYLFGCIKYRGEYKIYLMPIAYWILNYHKYDPNYKPKEWEFVFRKNVLNVTDANVRDFMKAVAVDMVELENDFSQLLNVPKEKIKLYFFIDIDEKNFVSSFPDIEVENYLPDGTWHGSYENPIRYLPENLKVYFA